MAEVKNRNKEEKERKIEQEEGKDSIKNNDKLQLINLQIRKYIVEKNKYLEKLEKWEREYSMKSERFIELVEKRRMGEEEEIDEWAGEYYFYQELVKRINWLERSKVL